jgi:hypothetical protein
MANVIIFTDNPPRNIGNKNSSWYLDYLSYPAGAYAIASHLRLLGYSVLVVPHCSKLSYHGVEKIISLHSKDLVWVGLSTTFFYTVNGALPEWQTAWHECNEPLMNTDLVTRKQAREFRLGTQPIWGTTEINRIAKFIGKKYNIPFLIGGAWVTHIANGGLAELESNVHIIKGTAELAAELSTRTRSVVQTNNDTYDNTDFKNRTYVWTPDDQIDSSDWLPLEISRGCFFNCAFCNYDRKSTLSYRNPESLKQELIKNYEQFGITKYIVMDDLYNDSKEKVRTLYDQVWSQLPFQPEWTSYMRLDMIYADPESADFLKHSGARLGSFGIETLHDKAGRRVGKGLGKARILETLSNLKQTWGQDTLIMAYFIMGLPDEPEESMLETIAWLETNNDIFSYSAAPMWITPPEHNNIALKQHPISLDNQKYGITWIGDSNWKNREGITFTRAQELASMLTAKENRNPISFAEYGEFRQMGFSHCDIANIQTTGIHNFKSTHQLSYETTIQNKMKSRLEKYLN